MVAEATGVYTTWGCPNAHEHEELRQARKELTHWQARCEWLQLQYNRLLRQVEQHKIDTGQVLRNSYRLADRLDTDIRQVVAAAEEEAVDAFQGR